MDDSGTSKEELSLSVEETNRLRASLGLRPLSVGSPSGAQSKATDRDAVAVENLKRYRAEESRTKKRMELSQKLQRERERGAQSLVSGPTLSEATPDGPSDDALQWIQNMRNKTTALNAKSAEKKAREWDELEGSAKPSSYASNDLAGLRVAHDTSDFVEGEETILVLKDARITDGLDNQDELLSVAMTEAARDKENSENRKKRPGYTAYDEDDGSTPGLALGRKKELLSQYDSEIYGPKQTGFTLSSGGVADSVRQEETLSVAEKLKASAAVTLDYAKNGAIQDYYTQDEIATTTFRKTKKSGKKKTSSATKNSRRKKTPEPEEQASLEDTEMTDDGQAQFSKSNKASSLEDINFVDDDDLQAALSRARKLAASKQKAAATGAEEVAQAIANMKQESESDAEEAHNGLVISDTTEFVRTLLHSTVTEPKPKGRLGAVQEKKESSQIKQEPVEEEEVTQMDVEGTEIEETVIEDSKDDIKMETDSDDSGEAAVAEEPLVSRGMAATLALLSQKGVVQLASPEERARQQKLRERELWLVEERKKEKLRQLDQDKDRQRTRALEKSGRLTGREIERQREEEARRLERERFKLAEEKFKNYIPDVKIEYRDEFGRQLSTKEAYKQLAHKFHGKAPGKKKTEKRLQRIQEEIQLQKAMSSAAFAATSNAFTEATKSTGTAHVTLSIGNRAAKLPEIQRPVSTSAPDLEVEATPQTFEPAPEQPAPIIPEQREKIAFGFGLKRKTEDFSSNVKKKLKEGQ